MNRNDLLYLMPLLILTGGAILNMLVVAIKSNH